MPAPESIKQLTERFREHIDTYTRSNYNETQLRREFLDPFFGALGWDVFNEKGYAGDYKDVVHEAALKIGGTTKAPDYSFRIGGQRKFFVEAKKPSVDVKGDPHPAYQLRRYAWTAQLPLSILTDFEEFAVYDCRIKPSPKDKAATARILYMTYDEYESRWGEIEAVFARESILKGGFDKYASAKSRKRGTAEPDDEFLQLLESWRSSLAQNIARNNDLSARQINHAVQLIIDRIVFLRICEDRGVEEAGTLQSIAKGKSIYAGLLKRFRLADAKYNSGLFHFENEPGREAPDTLTPSLTVSDALLKDVIANLYYPESPYEFSVFRAEMLGHIYERFLGSVISLSASGKTAKVEEKPEVRKAGGVYYTPTYIVDYIVEHTVGELLKNRTVELIEVGQGRGKKKLKVPRMDKPLRVLDPACGSGSFLLGAYDHLLDWHLRFYSSNDPESWATLPNPPIAHEAIPDEGAIHSDYKLTTHEKKRILTEHVFGVDIDAQAVEVTKLSLLLKVLEGENEETLQPLLFAKERALPDLSDNIQCGNSLIGSDFYTGQQGTMFDVEEQYRINAFDWEVAFEEIMDGGGFEAVIGNPPYVNAWEMFENQPKVRDYLNAVSRFETADAHWDLYVLFLEQAFQNLAESGRMAFIIPFSYAIQKYGRVSRRHFLERARIESIADLRSVRVFGKVPVITIIPVISKALPSSDHEVVVLKPGPTATRYHAGTIAVSHELKQRKFLDQHEQMLRLDMSDQALELCDRIDRLSIPTGDICFVSYGVQMSSKKKGAFGKDFVLRDTCESDTCRATIGGRNLYRYKIRWSGQYVEWALADQMYGPRNPLLFEKRKLMVRDITGTHRLELCVDELGLFCDHTVLCAQRACDGVEWNGMPAEAVDRSTRYSLELLQGLLASRLVSAYYYLKLTGEGVRTKGGFHTYPKTIRRLPVFDVASVEGAAICASIESNARQLLDMNERLHGEASETLTPQERRVLEGRISATDREIDLLVYELYGLTDDEIAIVEEATAT